jgi:hypothetical protein
MTRWETFRLLAYCLRPILDGRSVAIPDQPIDWRHLVAASSDHLVAPALGWSLRGAPHVPSDVFECFEALLALNGSRNDVILETLESAALALNSRGITPVLLKGAAEIVGQLYPDPGMRVLGDLDLLVPEMALRESAAALREVGLVVVNPRVRFDGQSHHLPSLIHPDSKVSIELHWQALPARHRTLVDSARCIRQSVEASWRSARVAIAEPTERVAHTVAHAQVVDEHYWRGIPRFRSLLELALLRRRYRDEIDWPLIEQRFRVAGFGRVLSDTLELSEALIEEPERNLSSDALIRLKVNVNHPERLKWSIYRRALVRNCRRVIDNPRFLLNTLTGKFWEMELAGIVRRLQSPRW